MNAYIAVVSNILNLNLFKVKSNIKNLINIKL